MKFIIYLSIIALGLFSCGQKAQDAPLNEEVIVEKTVTPPPPVETLEAAPQKFLESILARATGIEATMYSSGASFSVFDKNSVFSFMQMISLNAPKATSKNQIGHIMFLQDGNNILISNVYDNGSDVYVMSKDEESGKKYYNILTGKAADMFVNMQVKGAE